jgi:hypothetical protein
MDTLMPSHFPNHCFIKLLNGSSTPAFSASSLGKVVNPGKAFVMVPSGIIGDESAMLTSYPYANSFLFC